MTKLATTRFKTHMINQFIESINETANNSYYVYVGNHINRTSNTIPTPFDKTRETFVDAYRNMQFGKRLSNTNVLPMIRRIPYENKLFIMYDDNDDDLFTQDFYCVVDETSFHHVYKCLDNNGGINSTAQPNFAHITGSNTTVYQTSDGYRWKYMYSFSADTNNQFSTESFMPVVANSQVESNAVQGAIDMIHIEQAGRRYNNYTEGTFGSGDVRVGGNSVLYRVSNADLSQVNGFYTDCIIYISSGDGVGQYKTVSDYFSNSSGAYIVANSQFTNAPTNGSTFEINPRVRIYGDGTQSINAVARALVNSTSSNSIYRIEMLNRGSGYKYMTANVAANAVVGVSLAAELRPIYSPLGGHGANSAVELGCKYLGVGVTLSNNESNTIPTANDYEKIGILKDPKFANVDLKIYNSNGTFTTSEKIVKIDTVRINTNATINTTSATIQCNTADFTNQLIAGQYLYIKDATTHMLAVVNSIPNVDHITLTTNGLFTSTNADIYQVTQTANAYITSIANTTDLFISNVAGIFQTDDFIIGTTSGAVASVNTVYRNDENKGFNTFIQMYKYKGAGLSGIFAADEQVYQGTSLSNSSVNGYFHSVTTNGATSTMYVSNQIGTVNTSTIIEGHDSEATMTVTHKYSPELVYGSGEILSIENIETVTRANLQSESFKLIFEF